VVECSLKKVIYEKQSILKLIAITIIVIIITPSIMILNFIEPTNSETIPNPRDSSYSIIDKPVKIGSVATEDGTWEQIDDSPPGTPAESFVVVSDTSGITVVAEFNGFWRFIDDNANYSDTVEIPGASYLKENGKPMIPRLITYLEIPHEINVSLDVLYGVPITYDGYAIGPAPREVIPLYNMSNSPTTTPNSAIYSSSDFYPGYSVGMEGGYEYSQIIMRGRRLLELSFYPMQFSPGLGQLNFIPKLVVKVNYESPAQIEPVSPRLWSDPFERIFEGILLNYNPWNPETGTGLDLPSLPEFGPEFGSKFTPSSSSIVQGDYLIITHENFKKAADRLAAWKTQKGLRAEVVQLGEIPVTTSNRVDDIKAYIQDAYNQWNVGPSYVLLFGDSEFVPNGYGTIHTGVYDVFRIDGDPIMKYDPSVTFLDKDGNELHLDSEGDVPTGAVEQYIYNQDTGRIGTNLFYFTVHGDDYVPDIIYGRISVDTEDEAENVVEKILAYEKSPPNNPDFYNNILSSAFFQDIAPDKTTPRDGISDPGYPFVWAAEDVRLYLENERGYITHLNYTANYRASNPSSVKPIGFYSDSGTVYFYNSRYAYLDNIIWIPEGDPDESTENITANIDAGRCLVYFNGHGGSKNFVNLFDYLGDSDTLLDRDEREGWSHPKLNDTDLPTLSNGELLPLVISLACNTGWFDGEIDGEDGGVMGPLFADVATESFSENITRMNGGGAIAAIGASRHSYTLTNNDLLDGIIQAFWPGYLPQWSNRPIYEMGAALLFGKMNAASIYGYSDGEEEATSTTFQVYHLFGDPELQLWTDVPSDLTVSYPTQMSTDGRQQFVVTVLNGTDPVYAAKVCIQGESDYLVGYTNSYGQVVFDVNPTSDKPYNVTVTKHNFIPHIGEIQVINCDAILTLSKYQATSFTDITFTVSGFDGGEDVHIFFNETELETILAGTNSMTDQIPFGRDGYANIKANDSDEVAIVLFKRYMDVEGGDPYVYSQHDDSTWHLANGHLTYDNPSIEIYEMVGTQETWVDSNELEQFSNYYVHVNVTNNLDVEAQHTEVTLAWAMFSVGRAWHVINEDEPAFIDVPKLSDGGWIEAVIEWTPDIPGHICLNASVFYINDENVNNNVGQENTDVAELQVPSGSQHPTNQNTKPPNIGIGECAGKSYHFIPSDLAPSNTTDQLPGGFWFQVGNPTNETSYVFLDIRQQDASEGIWYASVEGLSYLPLDPGSYETISLSVTPQKDVQIGDSRLFTVSLYIGGEYIGGLSIEAVIVARPLDPFQILVLILGAVAVAVVIIGGVILLKKSR
jgi:hypothetical protein